GAVYVFSRSTGTWAQEAYIKASNKGGFFGDSLALSADGTTLAVGADAEASGASGIDGDQSDVSTFNAGAAYLFRRQGTTWSQEAYVKASNARTSAQFGLSVALSGDGSMLAVGAPGESSKATGINGDQSDASADRAGAVYVFSKPGGKWQQDAYVKAS